MTLVQHTPKKTYELAFGSRDANDDCHSASIAVSRRKKSNTKKGVAQNGERAAVPAVCSRLLPSPCPLPEGEGT